MTRPTAGHRSVPHTADLRIQARAPSRIHLVLAGPDTDMLAAALEEVIYRMDTTGQIPVTVTARAASGGLQLACTVADAEAERAVGAVPKAVSLNDLRFEHRSGGWECLVTLDV